MLVVRKYCCPWSQPHFTTVILLTGAAYAGGWGLGAVQALKNKKELNKKEAIFPAAGVY